MILIYENREVEVDLDCNDDGTKFIKFGHFIDTGEVLDEGALIDLEDDYPDRLESAPSPRRWRRE